MIERPQSEKLIELHVYVIPSALWQDKLRSAVNQVISDTISAGFIRVRPDGSLVYLREEIVKQLGLDVIPREFIFCKSVGRCLTQVRLNQESVLKAHHFLPPNSYCPEIFLLDINTASRSTPSLKDSSKLKLFSVSNTDGQHSEDIENYTFGKQDAYNKENAYSKEERNMINASGDSKQSHLYSDFIPPDGKNFNTSQQNSNDYFQTTLFVNDKTPSMVGHINLSDYPSLTSEEIRMLQGMSESEVFEYLKNNGHVKTGDHNAGDSDPQNVYNANSDAMYEDDGPQRSRFIGNMGSIPTVNIQDTDFDDANMSELEKYEHYCGLIGKYKNERLENESRKDDLIRRAKQLYTKTANQKNIARDMWKKRYFDEKKRNAPMEDHLNKQRSELDSIHRKILGMMENFIKENRTRGTNQSVIDIGKMRMQSKKLEYEIEEAQRAVDEAKLKLTCEIKMTHQARAEVYALRADLVQKKINLSMARSLHLSSMGTQDVYRPTRVSLIKPSK